MTKTTTETATETAASEQPAQATINSSPKPLRKLTRKQAAFVKHIVDNPKASATQAAAAAYNTHSRHSAEVIASENLSKPEILAELAKYSNTAEIALINLLNTSIEYSSKGNTAGASYTATGATIANSILDRLHGKATQRVETASTSVTLNIDLS